MRQNNLAHKGVRQQNIHTQYEGSFHHNNNTVSVDGLRLAVPHHGGTKQ